MQEGEHGKDVVRPAEQNSNMDGHCVPGLLDRTLR